MIRASRVLFCVLPVLMVATAAFAERPSRGTIGLYLDDSDGNALTRAGVTKVGEPFEIVVRIDTEVESAAVMFQMTELNLLFPGIFKVSTWIYNESIFDLGRNDIGEYVFPYGGVCAPADGVIVTRVGYMDVTGELPEDVLLYVGGLEEGQIHLRELETDPGYIGCLPDDVWALEPEPWNDDSFDPTQIDGVTSTDGLLVLNPSQMVPVGDQSFSALKARF